MTPKFAVVGHPNKGKSSIVATLAQNDDIAISTRSGTTTHCQQLDVNIGHASYSLIDTPGFQRPTLVLAWLQKQASTADKRINAVKAFLLNEDCQRQFPDEVELLTPIMDGAAIIYVVDGSRPYGAEYEAEMEILRWTGQASLALINPIENEHYIEEWQQALGQYFKVVRVFNAMQAETEKQLSVLQSFSTIREDWKEAIDQLVVAYKTRSSQRIEDTAELLAALLTNACAYQLSQKVLNKEQANALRSSLEIGYFAELKSIEKIHHDGLKALFFYHHLTSEIEKLPDTGNLFDTEKWIVWGLNRKQLVTAAAMAGAAAGAVIDLGMAGSSFFLGALGGGVVGATSAWLGADKLADFKLEGLPVGGYVARQGPMQNKNFPYVLVGRFLQLESLLQQRTHARRDTLVIAGREGEDEGELQAKISELNDGQQKSLHKALARVSGQKTVEDLAEILKPLLSSQQN
ncbi:MAG: GTPase Era involved in 16S rRNA processing [Candidatus Azotimanducaceae bacterium]|jgi:GTPase Era involved in 16S rRNA processing